MLQSLRRSSTPLIISFALGPSKCNLSSFPWAALGKYHLLCLTVSFPDPAAAIDLDILNSDLMPSKPPVSAEFCSFSSICYPTWHYCIARKQKEEMEEVGRDQDHNISLEDIPPET